LSRISLKHPLALAQVSERVGGFVMAVMGSLFFIFLFFEAKTFEFELEEGASVVRIYER
jgi:hypothetical protein